MTAPVRPLPVEELATLQVNVAMGAGKTDEDGSLNGEDMAGEGRRALAAGARCGSARSGEDAGEMTAEADATGAASGRLLQHITMARTK